MADVETGAFVVAGVALVAALTLWLTEPRAGTSAHAASTRAQRAIIAGVVAEW